MLDIGCFFNSTTNTYKRVFDLSGMNDTPEFKELQLKVDLTRVSDFTFEMNEVGILMKVIDENGEMPDLTITQMAIFLERSLREGIITKSQNTELKSFLITKYKL